MVRLFIVAMVFCGLSFNAVSLEAIVLKAQTHTKQTTRIGQLAFFKTYQESFKSSGKITQLAIEEGQAFKKGEVLAKVDTDDLSSELNQLIAEKAFVNKEIERLKKLKKVDAVSQSELDRQKSRSSQLRAQIIRTREFLDAAHIVANFDGVVVSRLADSGEFVTAGQPVLNVAPLVDNFVVEVAVQDRLLQFLEVGQQVVLKNTQSDASLIGEVKTLAQMPDKSTGLFIVKIAVTDSPDVRVGALYNVTLTQEMQMVYAVPVKYAQVDFNNTALLNVSDRESGKAMPERFKVIDHDYQTIFVMPRNSETEITLTKAN